MLTPTQKQTAQALVNIFETGSVLGDYGNVTLIAGDTGHLTYGRSQTTLGSGNLADLLRRYCGNPGARFGARLSEWLPRVEATDLALDHDNRLHNVLRACADDPVMRDTQDQFFDDVYWAPAMRAAEKLGIVTALGSAVVYDSMVHGSWGLMRDRTTQTVGAPSAIGEKAWIMAYVETRRHWLANHPRRDLRATVYRVEALQRLVAQGRWGLDLPLVVRGNEISLLALRSTPPGCYDGPQPGSRMLSLQSPLIRGLDSRLVQFAMSDVGIDVKADGVFGPHSIVCLKQYQQQKGLPVTGVADPALVVQMTG